jgi:hypothetical protein
MRRVKYGVFKNIQKILKTKLKYFSLCQKMHNSSLYKGDRGYAEHFFSLRCHSNKNKNYEKKSIGVIPWHLFTFGNFFNFFR